MVYYDLFWTVWDWFLDVFKKNKGITVMVTSVTGIAVLHWYLTLILPKSRSARNWVSSLQ